MSKIKTNSENCPIIMVSGGIAHPQLGMKPKVDAVTGVAHRVIGTGGIVYNVTLGDKVMGIAGDHVEPCVSSKNTLSDGAHKAYLNYTCVGNEVEVVSGDAKGAKGFVFGKHGGCDHVLLYFSPAVLEKLTLSDSFEVKAQGIGMKLLEHPDVEVSNTSQALIDKMNIEEKEGKLLVGVSKIIPAQMAGSGVGVTSTTNGDFDISLTFPEIMEQNNLFDLRFGDIVAITDFDGRHGIGTRAKATTIGVVVHSDCILPGHGPGITILMSAMDGKIVPKIDETATLKDYFVGLYQNEK